MYQHSQDFRLYIDYGGINLTICFLSRKYSKILFAVFAFFLLAVSFLLGFAASHQSRYVCIGEKNICISAADPQQHKAFARQLGLETADYPEMIQKVRIPQEFNGLYEKYNNLQKNSGFDLLTFRGKKCTLYTYRLQNKKFSGEYLLNLMVFRDRIIGGDVSKDKYKGSICSFSDILSDNSER